MRTRVACSVTAAMFACISHAAPALAQQDEIEDTPISLVGCVMREIDYRKQVGAERGGFLGLGGGLGDEYMLVRATRDLAVANVDCATPGGDAYELTGSDEELVETFLGQAVVLTGVLKEADIDPATGRPTGGNQVGGELRLFEVKVESVQAWVPPPPEPIAAAEEPPAPQPAPPAERPVATTGIEPAPELPKTASPQAMAGLFGLLALVGAAGFRIVRKSVTG